MKTEMTNEEATIIKGKGGGGRGLGVQIENTTAGTPSPTARVAIALSLHGRPSIGEAPVFLMLLSRSISKEGCKEVILQKIMKPRTNSLNLIREDMIEN